MPPARQITDPPSLPPRQRYGQSAEELPSAVAALPSVEEELPSAAASPLVEELPSVPVRPIHRREEAESDRRSERIYTYECG